MVQRSDLLSVNMLLLSYDLADQPALLRPHFSHRGTAFRSGMETAPADIDPPFDIYAPFHPLCPPVPGLVPAVRQRRVAPKHHRHHRCPDRAKPNASSSPSCTTAYGPKRRQGHRPLPHERPGRGPGKAVRRHHLEKCATQGRRHPRRQLHRPVRPRRSPGVHAGNRGGQSCVFIDYHKKNDYYIKIKLTRQSKS